MPSASPGALAGEELFLRERLIDGPKRWKLEEPREAGFSPEHPRDRQVGIEACLPAFLETLHCREPQPGPLRQGGLGQVGVEPQLLRALAISRP